MAPAITITSEELRERVEEHLGRWIPDNLWERSEPYARRKLDLRSMLVALPGRLAVDVSSAATAAEASDIIRAEVYKILEELAGYKYDPEVYARRVRDREGWSELSDDADD